MVRAAVVNLARQRAAEALRAKGVNNDVIDRLPSIEDGYFYRKDWWTATFTCKSSLGPLSFSPRRCSSAEWLLLHESGSPSVAARGALS